MYIFTKNYNDMKKENRTPEEIKVDILKEELQLDNWIWANGKLARVNSNVIANEGEDPTVGVKYLEISHDMEYVKLKDCDPIIVSQKMIERIGFKPLKDIPELVEKLNETPRGREVLHQMQISIRENYGETIYLMPNKKLRFDFIMKSNGIFDLVIPNDKSYFGEEHHRVTLHLLQNYFKNILKEELNISQDICPSYEPYLDLK